MEFQPISYVVNEDDGVVSFTIVKRTPTTQDITVQISTTDGSATCGLLELYIGVVNSLMHNCNRHIIICEPCITLLYLAVPCLF